MAEVKAKPEFSGEVMVKLTKQTIRKYLELTELVIDADRAKKRIDTWELLPFVLHAKKLLEIPDNYDAPGTAEARAQAQREEKPGTTEL